MVVPVVAAGARAAAGRTAAARAAATRGRAAAPGGGGGEVSYRVSVFIACLMLATAGIIDLVQLFLTLTVFLAPASIALTFIAFSVFALWFLLLGVSYVGGSKAFAKLGAAGAGVIIEFVPLINALPATTAAVLAVILISRMEDREKARKSGSAAAQPSTTAARRLPRAANDNRYLPTAANDNDSDAEDFREAA